MPWWEIVLRSEWFWYGLIAVTSVWCWLDVRTRQRDHRGPYEDPPGL